MSTNKNTPPQNIVGGVYIKIDRDLKHCFKLTSEINIKLCQELVNIIAVPITDALIQFKPNRGINWVFNTNSNQTTNIQKSIESKLKNYEY